VAARAASAFSFVSSREVQGEGQAARYRREGAAAAAIATAAQVEHIIMMGVTFATVVLIIRLAVPGEDLHDFYPGGGRDDNMIGFFNAHDCKVAACLVVSIHNGPIEASCYEWDPFEHELGEKFSETSRPDS
jgi:hypothetical protein